MSKRGRIEDFIVKFLNIENEDLNLNAIINYFNNAIVLGLVFGAGIYLLNNLNKFNISYSKFIIKTSGWFLIVISILLLAFNSEKIILQIRYKIYGDKNLSFMDILYLLPLFIFESLMVFAMFTLFQVISKM